MDTTLERHALTPTEASDPINTSRNTCAYTVRVGDHKTWNEQPVAAGSDLPFIGLTGNPRLTSQSWCTVQAPTAFAMDPTRSQRLLKIGPHRVDALAGFDQSLYIDNAVLLRESPQPGGAAPHGPLVGPRALAFPTRSALDQHGPAPGGTERRPLGAGQPRVLVLFMAAPTRRTSLAGMQLSLNSSTPRLTQLRQSRSDLLPARRDQDKARAATEAEHQALEQARQHIADLTERLAATQQASTDMTRRHVPAAEAMTSAVAAVRSSTSWRLTAPLRQLKNWLN